MKDSLVPKTKVVNLRYHQYDVYIGRPSKYGNPFKVGIHGTQHECVEQFREWVYTQTELLEDIKTNLTGKTLGCFCVPKVCHGDVLVEICERHQDFSY